MNFGDIDPIDYFIYEDVTRENKDEEERERKRKKKDLDDDDDW